MKNLKNFSITFFLLKRKENKFYSKEKSFQKKIERKQSYFCEISFNDPLNKKTKRRKFAAIKVILLTLTIALCSTAGLIYFISNLIPFFFLQKLI